MRKHVEDRAGRRACAELLDEGHHAAERTGRRCQVGTALEPGGGLGLQPEPPARGTYGGRFEPRAFDGHARRRARHLRCRAPHHSGERDRAVTVGNDEHALVERARLSVERHERLARPRAAHADFGPRQQTGVERMCRMPDLEHHVVGDVDDVVDGAHAGCLEPVGQPGRRWADADVCDGQRVAPAPRVVDGDGDRAVRCRGHLAPEMPGPERDTESDRGLAGEAIHAQAVGPICRDLEVDRVAFDACDLEAAPGQACGHQAHVVGDGGKLTEPGERRLHSGT